MKNIELSAEQLTHIQLAHSEQSLAVNHLGDALNNIELSANENAAVARRVTEQSVNLSDMSKELVQAASYFSAK